MVWKTIFLFWFLFLDIRFWWWHAHFLCVCEFQSLTFFHVPQTPSLDFCLFAIMIFFFLIIFMKTQNKPHFCHCSPGNVILVPGTGICLRLPIPGKLTPYYNHIFLIVGIAPTFWLLATYVIFHFLKPIWISVIISRCFGVIFPYACTSVACLWVLKHWRPSVVDSSKWEFIMIMCLQKKLEL